nr:macro domain-containing protein [Gilliamella apicola]
MNNRIELLQADITKIPVDVIVNAANTSLLGGGGVDGAIHRAGGKTILEECIKIRAKQGGCKVGEAVITTAGNLPAKYVIHTVGPRWNNGNNDEEELLKRAYISCFKLASQYDIASISYS